MMSHTGLSLEALTQEGTSKACEYPTELSEIINLFEVRGGLHMELLVSD